jgi:hypothetical protein
MYKQSIFVILATIVMVVFSSCGSPSEPEGLDQETQDAFVAYGFVNSYKFIWNQNIAGTPVGYKDITVPGPQGGTVHIFGTKGYSSSTGINTVDLTLEMTNCKNSNVSYELTFTGTMICSGSWSSTYRAMGYSSDELSYLGTVDNENTCIEVGDVGPVSITETQNGLSGTICGRPFAYSYNCDCHHLKAVGLAGF